MIAIEWANNEKCANCLKENCPHVAVVNVPIPFEEGVKQLITQLCSDCIEDLKKRLS